MAVFLLLLVVFSLSFAIYPVQTTPASHAVHIVYLGHNNGLSPSLTTHSHLQLLSRVFTKPDEAREAILYSYSCGFSGFAALLNSTQAATLSGTQGVVSVFRSRMLEIHTTRSWDFMGLHLHMQMKQPSQRHLKFGDDVILGVLDTGVWPESESFRDDPHYGPIPSSWKGTCVKGDEFDPATACNRKLIGARYYLKGFESELGPLNTSDGSEYRSPRDRVGHGTHTASTAVGSVAPNASYFGLGHGAARGGAPRARLAVYKVCWYKDLTGRCSDADILAAFDEALCDGVHVVSASLGSPPPLMPLLSTSTEIGAFHAMQRGVVSVFSAGNDGPDASMVQNVSPWGLTVAASTIDRRFPTVITLGNNASIVGESFIVKAMKNDLVDSSSVFADGTCTFDQLINRTAASGKIVLCFATMGTVSSDGAALAVYAGNGAGVIFADTLSRKSSQDSFWPTVHVDLYQGTQILYYIRDSRCVGEELINSIMDQANPLSNRAQPLRSQQSDGAHISEQDGRRRNAGARRGVLLFQRAELRLSKDPQARRDRPRSEHTGGMAAQVVADGNPPGQALDGVELRLRHVHVVPARLRHRRGHQVRAPDLVAGGRQVRPHDHSVHVRRHVGRDAGRRDGEGGGRLRRGRGARGPASRAGPRAGLRRGRARPRAVPLQPGLHGIRDPEHGAPLPGARHELPFRRRGGGGPRGPQLPGHRATGPGRHGDGEADGDQRGREPGRRVPRLRGQPAGRARRGVAAGAGLLLSPRRRRTGLLLPDRHPREAVPRPVRLRRGGVVRRLPPRPYAARRQGDQPAGRRRPGPGRQRHGRRARRRRFPGHRLASLAASGSWQAAHGLSLSLPDFRYFARGFAVWTTLRTETFRVHFLGSSRIVYWYFCLLMKRWLCTPGSSVCERGIGQGRTTATEFHGVAVSGPILVQRVQEPSQSHHALIIV